MAFKFSENILGVELDISYAKFLSDDGFLYFCISFNNQTLQMQTEKHELQYQFKKWAQKLINDFNACAEIFGNNANIIFSSGFCDVSLLLNVSIDYYLSNKISDEHLEWVDSKNERQVSFVKSTLKYISFVNQLGANSRPILTPQVMPNINFIKGDDNPFSKNETSMTTIKNTLTCMNSTMEQKNDLISQIKIKWIIASAENNISEWIAKGKKDQITNWLKQQELFTNTISNWLSPYSVSHDFIKVIILHFDLMTVFTPDSAKLRLKQLKQSWSQSKTREKNKDNTQVNFILPVTTKEKLISICAATGVSRNKFLEGVIKDEYEKLKNTHKDGG
ncbi:hypothetical protein ACV1C9_11535 [Aeromonas caviae]